MYVAIIKVFHSAPLSIFVNTWIWKYRKFSRAPPWAALPPLPLATYSLHLDTESWNHHQATTYFKISEQQLFPTLSD